MKQSNRGAPVKAGMGLFSRMAPPLCCPPRGAMTNEDWNIYKKRSKEWNVRISFELLHSKAYLMLSYGPAIKLLSWMHEKIKVEKIQNKRGKQRFQIKDDGKFSFTYKEANHRGLSGFQLYKGLRELHSYGFLEVQRPGSSLRGDFSIYTLSDRWRLFGQPGFEEKEFPVSVHRIDSGFKLGNKVWRKREKLKKKLHVKTNIYPTVKTNM